MKRSSAEKSEDNLDVACNSVNELKAMVEEQGNHIGRLQNEKAEVLAVLSGVRTELEKSSSDNRILKRAVSIQQERQNQALSELEAACRYKVDAENRMRRLEHMNLSLRFQLQARDAGPAHDFMGFNPRPPDVC